MSIKTRINNIYSKFFLFNANLMMAKNSSVQTLERPTLPSTNSQIPSQALQLSECSLKDVNSNTYKNQIQALFEEQLNQNMPHYTKTVTSYFAHLILFHAVQSKNGDSITPDSLTFFDTLEEMFPLVALVDTPKDDSSISEFTTVDTLTLEGALRWFSETYVKTQFEYMLLEEVEGVALIDHVLFHEESRPPLRQLAIEALTASIGEVFFIRLRAELLNTLRDKTPTDLFKAGEFDAKVMTNSYSKDMEDRDEESQDFLKSIARVNNLWLRVITNYERLFCEKIPKTRVTEEMYDSKLVLVLLNLKNDGVTAEEIRELATLDNKLDLEVRRKIASFDFIRG